MKANKGKNLVIEKSPVQLAVSGYIFQQGVVTAIDQQTAICIIYACKRIVPV